MRGFQKGSGDSQDGFGGVWEHPGTRKAPRSCVCAELRNNRVVKFPGEAAERVARVLLSHGAATTSELASELNLSPQAVRRSLSSLEEAGLVHVHSRVPFGPLPSKRRGRPSSSYSLSDQGRNLLKQSYNDLALDSLEFLDRTYGREAVRLFAAERAHRIITGKSIPELVNALNSEGYEATFEQAGVSGQLCQHHCPVVDAARAYPELCEEETRALGESLGTHPTRLATLAQGDPICTTLIPQVSQTKRPKKSTHTHLENAPLTNAPLKNAPLMEEVSA